MATDPISRDGWSEGHPAGGGSHVFQFVLSKLGFVVLAFLTAACAVAVTAGVSTAGPKKAYAALVLGGLAWATFLYKRPKDIFLFGWLFSLTYNRQYFIFQRLTPDSGMQAPYVIVADVFLLALFVVWYYEAAILRIPSRPLGGRMWPWYLPFVAACFLSLWAAVRMDWTLFELIRVIKVGLILWWARYNLKAREWWICVAAIGCAVTAQSTLGVLEVVFKRSGVLWLLGAGTAEAAAPEMFQAENFYGFRRATATMNHPPNLACYLLLTLPVCFALALTHRDVRWRIAGGVAGILGLACLACTQSRWPIALIVVMLPALVLGLALLKTIRLKPALAILIWAALLASVGAASVYEKLQERIKSDLKASVDLRKRGNRAAMDMLVDKGVFFGIGLNNYRAHAAKYEPDSAWVDEYEEFAVTSHLRFIAGPLNGFLLILTESGGVGLSAFIVYLIGVTVVAIKAIKATSGPMRAVVFALAVGFAGVLAQQAVDYSYWVDPILYTATLVVGMLNCAKSVQDQTPRLRQT